jgi:hypothetical protein
MSPSGWHCYFGLTDVSPGPEVAERFKSNPRNQLVFSRPGPGARPFDFGSGSRRGYEPVGLPFFFRADDVSPGPEVVKRFPPQAQGRQVQPRNQFVI